MRRIAREQVDEVVSPSVVDAQTVLVTKLLDGFSTFQSLDSLFEVHTRSHLPLSSNVFPRQEGANESERSQHEISGGTRGVDTFDDGVDIGDTVACNATGYQIKKVKLVKYLTCRRAGESKFGLYLVERPTALYGLGELVHRDALRQPVPVGLDGHGLGIVVLSFDI
jgi:hypothetical protein